MIFEDKINASFLGLRGGDIQQLQFKVKVGFLTAFSHFACFAKPLRTK